MTLNSQLFYCRDHCVISSFFFFQLKTLGFRLKPASIQLELETALGVVMHSNFSSGISIFTMPRSPKILNKKGSPK